MYYHEQSEDYRPLFWIAGLPIYAYRLIMGLHIIAFVTTGICIAALGGDLVVPAIALNTDHVIRYGELWRLISYVIFLPSLWFVFAMGFLYFAGQQVEQFVGWKVFLKLYAALVIIPAAILCLVGFAVPLGHLGGSESIFGVFVAFATIYPGVVINIWFVNLTTKGWAYVLLGVYSLIDMAGQHWAAMLMLWSSAGVGYLGMRLIGAGRGMTWFTEWLEDRQAKRLARVHNLKVLKDTKESDSIDEILDKISKQGVGSLSAKERAALERARTNLLKRDER